MGVDKSAENTKNVPKLISQIGCPCPEVWDPDEKIGFMGRL
jgi:hypothetical protein